MKVYRVIEIMNEKEIIVNYGRLDGAIKNDAIRIYSKGEEIFDPKSKISLGTLDIVKADLKVYKVFEKFSVLRNIKKKTVDILDPLTDYYESNTFYEKIEVNKEQITNRTIPKNTVVEVGDLAIKI